MPRTGSVAGCVLAGAVVLAGCTGGGGTGSGAGGDGRGTGAAAPAVSQTTIRITPRDGASGVPATGTLSVTAEGGVLTQVKVADAAGTQVPGRIDSGGHAWHPTGKLALETKYTVDALAEDSDGRRAAKHAEFTTLVPQHRLIAFYTPEAGATVGAGMIVSITFNRSVADRAAVERAITVTAQPAAQVAPHWFGAQRLDFRPQHFWTPGTKVDLRLRLRDVQGAPGVYGSQQKDVVFTIGRSQTSVVDAEAHTMTVRRDGQVVRTLPVSTGSPEHATYGGKMVISEKLPVTRMNGDTVGYGGEYNIPDVPHAMRLTQSGTFVHGNYWSPKDTFGAANTSHGCVGLSDVKGGGAQTPAGWFFGSSLVGDVVEVVNAHDATVAPDNGLSGWNLTWEQWLAGSAVSSP
ncbi:Ig-like domain-containing protein [Streptomyces ferralitis]|uniref:Ig-like domain-containing protein n=1 Tax=Streptantibioticus ferralitis TaxID=236510 RepID=A0ABT5YS49_9ACTN|nr:Ig-like domain-containing protein [Streptantibioticus ferralitis]MDF2254425.1 Ig-like domain-containing protein [Streptantibioticus ferralitis]